jgi:hypothetical protein
LGEAITNRTLVLNIICGLNERFASIGMHLRRGHPFPTFLEFETTCSLNNSVWRITQRPHPPCSSPSAPTVLLDLHTNPQLVTKTAAVLQRCS